MVYTDVELAILSQLAYKDVQQGETLWSALVGNCGYLEETLGPDYKSHISNLIVKVKDSGCYIAKAQTNTGSGFSAFAVADPINNNVVVACRGTELGKIGKDPITAGKDLYEDVNLALKQQTLQQKDMDVFMNDLQKGGYGEYSFTGHSLGGNLAMYGAITLKDKSKLKECKTFNAPGFNKGFHKKYKNEINAAKKRMTAYQNKYDGVSEALTVPGTVVVVDSKGKDYSGFSGHMLDYMVIKDGKFKPAKPQKKSTTLLGLLLKYGGFVAENPETVATGSPFRGSKMAPNEGLTAFGVSGSHKIELNPEELKGQASEMLSLANEYEQLFGGVVSDLHSVNGNWSANLSHNFAGKITSAQGKFKNITELVSTGSAIATMAANNFESTDSVLTKVIYADTSGADDGGIVGVLRDTLGTKTVT